LPVYSIDILSYPCHCCSHCSNVILLAFRVLTQFVWNCEYTSIT